MEDAREDMTEQQRADALPVAVISAPKLATMLKPISVAEAVEGWKQYQELKRAILDPEDYQVYDGKTAPKKSAWRKIGRAFGICDEIVRENIARDHDGHILRCEMVVRVTAPNGQYAEGFGACSVTEARFKGEKSRMRADNDVPATAHTRAKSRAISDLVGGGEVSAEELDGEQEKKDGEVSVPTLATPAQCALVLKLAKSSVFAPREQQNAWTFIESNPDKDKATRFIDRLKLLTKERHKPEQTPQEGQGQPASEQKTPEASPEPGEAPEPPEQPELPLDRTTLVSADDPAVLDVAQHWEAYLAEGHAPDVLFDTLIQAYWTDALKSDYTARWAKAKAPQSKRNILREMAENITTV